METKEKTDEQQEGFDILTYVRLRDQLVTSEWSSSDELRKVKEHVNKEAIRVKYKEHIPSLKLLDLVTSLFYKAGMNINTILEKEAAIIEETNRQDTRHLARLRSLSRDESVRRSRMLNSLETLSTEKQEYETLLQGLEKELSRLEDGDPDPEVDGERVRIPLPPGTYTWRDYERELGNRREEVQENLETVYLEIEKKGELIEQSQLTSKAYANQMRMVKQKMRMKHKLQVGIYSPDFLKILDNNIEIAERAEHDEQVISGKAVITKTIIESLEANIGTMLRPYHPKFKGICYKKDMDKLRKEIESLHVNLEGAADQSKTTAESVLNKYL